MKKKIYILNPHKHAFITKTLDCFIKKSKIASGKYFFLKNLFNEGKVNIFISDDSASLNIRFNNKFLDKIFRLFFSRYIEIFLWLLFNKLLFKTRVVFDKNKIYKNDILFLFANSNLDQINSPLKKVLENLNCKKIIHLSHYFHNTKNISDNIKKFKNYYVCADINLKEHSRYFKKYFSFYDKKFLQTFLIARNDFKYEYDFIKRKNKAVSVGSFEIYDQNQINSYLENFYDFYKINTSHLSRKTIFEDKQKYIQFYDCLNSQISKDLDYRKRKYFDFNLNQIFNTYKMFICGEETASNYPGISFPEGMATGCVYIGKELEFYKDFGMIDGVNYISYKNSIETMVDKIKYYQNNPYKLEKISKNGIEIVNKKFNYNYLKNSFLDICNTI